MSDFMIEICVLSLLPLIVPVAGWFILFTPDERARFRRKQ
jgi:hypothetical protein